MSELLPPTDRVTAFWVRGMRTLEDVYLPLDGLTVLIGENGSGKSSLIEALEILRKVGDGEGLLGALVRVHDLSTLVRTSSTTLELGATIEGAGPRIEYELAVEPRRSGWAIGSERLDVFERGPQEEPLHAIQRSRVRCRYFEQGGGETPRGLVDLGVAPDTLALHALLADQGRRRQEAAARVRDALAAASVHVPFEVRAAWSCEERSWEAPLRRPSIVERATRLERLGSNLVNAYIALKERDDWPATLNDVRLGLGAAVRDIVASPAFRGQMELQLRYATGGSVPASGLSDGTLAYLAFVALVRLGGKASLLAIDEPEVHLDPGLLVRVVDMLDVLAETAPVVIATHSDRLLDSLEAPERSVVLCELDEARRTRLRRPSAQALAGWLEEYRGLGQLRASQPIGLVMDAPLDSRPRHGDEP